MFVVGGRGYVGSEVVRLAGDDAVVVSRDGADGSMPWQGLLAGLPTVASPVVVWLLDGSKHDELEHLRELIEALPDDSHVVYVSTSIVYGDADGALCDEDTKLSLITPHARLKAAGEAALSDARVATAVLRLGALYGPDPRGLRKDRIETWLSEAEKSRRVTVPDPTHWRGWLHRNQAARALLAAARLRADGVFNVACANATFADVVALAAELFDARVTVVGVRNPLTDAATRSRHEARDSSPRSANCGRSSSRDGSPSRRQRSSDRCSLGGSRTMTRDRDRDGR